LDGFLTVVQLIGSLIGVVAIIFLAYWSTKWFSKKYNSISSGKHIRIIERCMISQDKLLVLAKVKDKVYFLSISAQNVETIDTFDSSEFPEVADNENQPDFSYILKNKLINQVPFMKSKGNKEEDGQL
jgi:flagellar biogenesis protein FliO